MEQKLKYRRFQKGIRQYEQAFTPTRKDITAALHHPEISHTDGPYIPRSPGFTSPHENEQAVSTEQ